MAKKSGSEGGKKRGDAGRPGLDAAVASLRSRFKDRPLFRAPERRYVPLRHRALGVLLSGPDHPGLPTGCYIEVLGQEHSGKTSLSLAFADAVINQDQGATYPSIVDGRVVERAAPRKVLINDFEHSLDLGYVTSAVRNAVLPDLTSNGAVRNARAANLWLHQPVTLDEGADVAIALIESGEFGLVVMDSIAAMLSEEERGKSMGENTVGLTARAMGKFYRKTAHLLRKHGTTVVLVNQWRDKIGVAFGDPRTAPGGKATRYYAAVRIDCSGTHKTQWFPEGASKVVRVKTMKNKIAPKGEVTYHLGAGWGLSAEVELAEAAASVGAVRMGGRASRVLVLPKKSGAERTYPDVPTFLRALRGSDPLFRSLWAACEKRGWSPSAVRVTKDDADGWTLDVER